MRKKHIALALGLIFFILGISIPFWPFALVGILSCALMYPFFGIIFGVLADGAFGFPSGVLQYLGFPFAVFGFVAALFSIFASSRLRSRKMY